jgi:hypothetical protein
VHGVGVKNFFQLFSIGGNEARAEPGVLEI